MSSGVSFQVGVDKTFIQVAQYDTNVNDGNVNVYVSAFGGYSNTVTLSFAILPYQSNTQTWGTAGAGYTPASVVFSTIDRATGQTLSATAIVAPGGQTVTLTPPDVVQINIIPSTDPAQATAGSNMWQMTITGTDPMSNTSSAPVTILVQLGCPYLYGIAFENATVTTVSTGNDPAILNDAPQGRLFFVNGIFWLFYTFNDTQTAPGYILKDIAWAWSTDGYSWNILTNPRPRFGRFGFEILIDRDDFWDVYYDSTIDSFVCAVAQGIHANTVDFVIATPDNIGNLTVGFIDGDINGLTITENSALMPAVISSGKSNVWLAVSSENTSNFNNYLEVWQYNGSWSQKRLDNFDGTAFPKAVLGFGTTTSNVILGEGGMSGNRIQVFSTIDGGITWTTVGTTLNNYYAGNGNALALGSTMYFAFPDTLGKVRFFTVANGSLSSEQIIAAGSNASTITIQDSNHIYVSVASGNTVSLVGTTNGGVNWSSLQTLANTEAGLVPASLHGIQSTYSDPTTGHLSLVLAWVDYSGSIASLRASPVDLSNWPNIPTATSINSIIIPATAGIASATRPLNGFVYPIGVTSTPSNVFPTLSALLLPFNEAYYEVTASFGNGNSTMNIPAPVSVNSPVPFTVEVSYTNFDINGHAVPPPNMSFPFTTILIFQCNDGQNNANPACQAAAIVVVTVT